jgi:hypothetical protein
MYSWYDENLRMKKIKPVLKSNFTKDAQVSQTDAGIWHLEIPSGPKGRYRLAQLDDYTSLPRNSFRWRPPLTMTLRARVSAEEIPGTWGFGLWNDPFSLSLGLGGASRRFPALPNTAWFFFASPPNYLSFRDDIPAQGFLAATFQSPSLPTPLLALSSFGIPLLFIPPVARLLRSLLRRIVHQDSSLVSIRVTDWHTYSLEWTNDRLIFILDNSAYFETQIRPHGPLSLVLWIDNQYAAIPPEKRLSYGTLSNHEPAWIEITDLEISTS